MGSTGWPPSGDELFGPPAAGTARALDSTELAGIRRRLLLARNFSVRPRALPAEGWREMLEVAYRTYVADVAALLVDRRRMQEQLAALRRIAVAAEAALVEDHGERQEPALARLVEALKSAGYETTPASRRPSTAHSDDCAIWTGTACTCTDAVGL
jgi:hypothetical protein